MYNTEKFIQKAKEKHGDFYDYSNVDYKGSKEKVEIVCPKHGSFWQRADAHLEGKGCPQCGHEKTGLATRKNIENKITRLPEIPIIESPLLCTNTNIVGSVYIFINIINNKIYIGKTIKSFTERWTEHKNCKDKVYFHKAINKYGWDNFNKYVIFQTEKLEDNGYNRKYLNDIILEKEKYYIKLYKSNDSNYGYNLTEGGDGVSTTVKFSEERLKKMRISSSKVVEQYDLNNNLIKVWPSMQSIKQELGWNLDCIRECCNLKRSSWKGCIWKFKQVTKKEKTLDEKQKSKVILQYDLNGKFIKEWLSAQEIQDKLGLDNHTVRGCCRGNYNTCGNYIWLYKESENICEQLNKDILINRKLYTPYIAQYDLNNNLIQLWESTSQLEYIKGYKKQSIRSCIRGKNKTSYGFIWREVERDSLSQDIIDKFKAFRDDLE